MYQALYRKYRPRTFDDVVGQQHITDTLRAQIRTDRLSHAYLFVGTRGTGKTTCAKILSRAANCEHPENGNPCNKCRSCLGIEDGSILDVEELDAASNNSVDNIRALRDEAVYLPASVKKRVYIVDEVHMLSSSAFNALLKILEEPPEHLIFILATTELHKVPATILSRCQRFTFRRIHQQDAAQRITQVCANEGIEITSGAAAMLSRLADGSMRDALSLLDQCGSRSIDEQRVLEAVGLAGAEETCRLLRSVVAGDIQTILKTIERMYFAGKELGGILQELSDLCRDILVNRLASDSPTLLSGGYQPAELESFADITPQQLLWYVRRLGQALSELSRSTDKRVSVELCLVQMSQPELSRDEDAILARIGSLEQALRSGVVPAAAPQPAPTPAAKEAAPTPPAQEKKPVPAPEPIPAPEPVPAAPADIWKSVLKKLGSSVSGATGMVLEQMQAELNGSELSIRADNEFQLMQVNTNETSAAIKKAAQEVTGRPVTVRFFAGENSGIDARLLKNSNISFKD